MSNNSREKLEEQTSNVLSKCNFRVYDYVKNKVSKLWDYIVLNELSIEKFLQ
jgi:hypothetical protein